MIAKLFGLTCQNYLCRFFKFFFYILVVHVKIAHGPVIAPQAIFEQCGSVLQEIKRQTQAVGCLLAQGTAGEKFNVHHQL